MSHGKIISEQLLKANAVKLSPSDPFVWSSGLHSPIYCDNRITLSYPNIRRQIIDGYRSLAAKVTDIDCIVGIATAGIAHGVLLADALNLPFSYVRSKAKGHGRKNRLEGYIAPGSRCLLIEDLISTGGSALNALEYLRSEGFQADHILAIFSYGLDLADKNFEEYQASYKSICSFDDLLHSAEAAKYISKKERQQLIAWQRDPRAWSDAHKN